jgi:N-formylglutamate deformylase
MSTPTVSPAPWQLSQGTIPLLISIPHLGTVIPDDLLADMTPVAAPRTDTDWHLDQLYGFAQAMGASVLRAVYSRYVIDLNRPPTGESLYPGQTTTGLCPTETFRGEPLYRTGREPDAQEIARRRTTYWQPYHDALLAELQRLLQQLWEAHSSASVLPRLFEGKLPDLNFGTASGASCAPAVLDAAVAQLQGASWSTVTNGRFKGGYITRHYGQPDRGIHAIQLELCQCLYMNEAAPYEYRPAVAAKLQADLHRILEAAVQVAQSQKA